MEPINKRIVIISLSVLAMLLGSCFNTVSAKLTSPFGEACGKPSTAAIQQAKESYNVYKIGQHVDLSPAQVLTKAMRVEKTIGKVHGQTVLKAGFSFDTYLYKLRGLNATAGKTFEESFRRSFNNMMTRQNGNYIIEATAALGNPHDAADLLVLDKQGNCVMKVQQKLSAKAAVNSIIHPEKTITINGTNITINKYEDCKILIPSDQLKKINSDLLNGTNKYIPKDPVQRKMIQEAVDSHILTDTIYGVKAKSMEYYQEATKRMYTHTFNNISDEMAAKLSRAIRNGEEFIVTGKSFYRVEEAISICRANNVVKPEIEAAIRSARFTKFVRVSNTVIGVAGSLIDVGYGVYMIYNAESQFQKGLLDSDLSNYKKTLGAIQIGVGVVGLVMVFSPEPFSKIAAPIVVVVGVLVAALDMWIDYIQAQRVAARQRMIDRIKAQDQPRAIRELLIRDMNVQCAL